MEVPLKKDFDLVLQVDKTDVANWDKFVNAVEFRFYFTKSKDINFEVCKAEMYEELQVDKESNALLCIYNSNNVALNLSAKNVFGSSNKLRRNEKKDDEFDYDKFSDEWYKRCQNKYGSNDRKCRKPGNGTEDTNQTENTTETNVTEPNTNETLTNTIENEGYLGGGAMYPNTTDEDNTTEENDTKDNDTEEKSTEIYSNYLLKEINRDNFTKSNFYIYPKCLLHKKCDEYHYMNYAQFVGSIKDMNLLFYSNNSKNSEQISQYAQYTGNSKQVINFNSGNKVDIYFKHTTIKTDYSIFPFSFKKNKLSFFSFDKTDTAQNTTFTFSGSTPETKIATHQEYNFYLSSYSDKINFKREPIDFLL